LFLKFEPKLEYSIDLYRWPSPSKNLDERHSVKYKYGYSKEQNRTEREGEMEVEVNTGVYHFIQFRAHITQEHLFKGT